jgi:hypothetical protein
MTNKLKDLIKDFVYSDFSDQVVVLSLEQQMQNSFEVLDGIDTFNLKDLPEDYFDNVALIRACITILKWYTTSDYLEETKRLNLKVRNEF